MVGRGYLFELSSEGIVDHKLAELYWNTVPDDLRIYTLSVPLFHGTWWNDTHLLQRTSLKCTGLSTTPDEPTRLVEAVSINDNYDLGGGVLL